MNNYAWRNFSGSRWQEEIDVRDFIQSNYKPYDGDEQFLTDPTPETLKLLEIIQELAKKEHQNNGVLDADTSIISTITSHKAGYIDRNLEKIVGLQTDEPFKRSLQPFGGIKVAKKALSAYGYELDESVEKIFTQYIDKCYIKWFNICEEIYQIGIIGVGRWKLDRCSDVHRFILTLM